MNYQNEQHCFFTPSYGQPPVNVFYLDKSSDGQFRGRFYQQNHCIWRLNEDVSSWGAIRELENISTFEAYIMRLIIRNNYKEVIFLNREDTFIR